MCWACTGEALNRIDLLGYTNLKSTHPTRKAVALENKVSGLNIWSTKSKSKNLMKVKQGSTSLLKVKQGSTPLLKASPFTDWLPP